MYINYKFHTCSSFLIFLPFPMSTMLLVYFFILIFIYYHHSHITSHRIEKTHFFQQLRPSWTIHCCTRKYLKEKVKCFILTSSNSRLVVWWYFRLLAFLNSSSNDNGMVDSMQICILGIYTEQAAEQEHRQNQQTMTYEKGNFIFFPFPSSPPFV